MSRAVWAMVVGVGATLNGAAMAARVPAAQWALLALWTRWRVATLAHDVARGAGPLAREAAARLAVSTLAAGVALERFDFSFAAPVVGATSLACAVALAVLAVRRYRERSSRRPGVLRAVRGGATTASIARRSGLAQDEVRTLLSPDRRKAARAQRNVVPLERKGRPAAVVVEVPTTPANSTRARQLDWVSAASPARHAACDTPGAARRGPREPQRKGTACR